MRAGQILRPAYEQIQEPIKTPEHLTADETGGRIQGHPGDESSGEASLKTPIVNRKIWGGNRADAGGEAESVTSSVLQTSKNKAIFSISPIKCLSTRLALQTCSR
jgi:hypothetical protein